MHGLLLLWFVPILVVNTHASPVTLDNEAAYTVTIRLIEESHRRHHGKRSAYHSDGPLALNLPDHLVFGVPVDRTGDVVLRLKRTAKLIPTVTSNRQRFASIRNASVYTDKSRHSSMIVRREGGKYYSLQGTFSHSDKEWNLQPLEKHSGPSGSHQLSPVHPSKDQGTNLFEGTRPASNGNPKVNTSHRNRRNASGGGGHLSEAVEHVVETSFIVDHSAYSSWTSYVGDSAALAEMQLWYTYVAESVNLRYQTIEDPDFSISVRVILLKILTVDSDDDFIEELLFNGEFDQTAGLQALVNWFTSQSDYPEDTDHYVLFTGFYMRSFNAWSYASSLCTSTSASIVENRFHATLGLEVAHELGHCMGANHFDCPGEDQYVMDISHDWPVSEDNTGHPWKFSTCSIEEIKTFLQGTVCTLPDATSGSDVLPAPVDLEDSAGQVLSRDRQCQLDRKFDNVFYCPEAQGDESTLCGGMYCTLPTGDECEVIVPQEYTSCGAYQQVCMLGFCVGEAPTTTATTATTTTTTASNPEPEETCRGQIFKGFRKWLKCTVEAWKRRRG